jgi:hypothetical protein
MYKTRKLLSALFALTLAFTLCACGGESAPTAPAATPESTAAADTGKSETAEPAESAAAQTESVVEVKTEVEPPKVELPVEGEYKIFAVEYEGYLIHAAEMEVESVITLGADSKGKMTMGEDSMAIASWTLDGSKCTITMEDESSADATVEDGVLILDLYGDESMVLYYAQEEADISMFSPMTADEVRAAMEGRILESKLGTFWSQLDSADAVHLSYDMHTEYMDATQSIDSYSKGGMFYSYKLTKVSGFESPSVVVFRDNTAYNLDPEKKTGVIATTVSSSYFSDNIERLDSLYSDIWTYAHETDCTSETREKDGVTYDVEYFPAGEYTAECAFYFDENGQLVYVEKGAPVIEGLQDIGTSTYTIKAIDNEVDEALFDISGYEITE